MSSLINRVEKKREGVRKTPRCTPSASACSGLLRLEWLLDRAFERPLGGHMTKKHVFYDTFEAFVRPRAPEGSPDLYIYVDFDM